MICNIITQPVRDLAKELNISPSYANNLVSVWRNVSKSTTEDYPKANTLKSIMKWNQEIELATPEYTAIEYNEGDKLAFTSKDYKITLGKVFSKKPLEYFFDYIQGKIDSPTSKQKQIVFERLENQGYSLDKIRDLVQDGKEAYRFLLWHEMSHIENDDYSKYWKEGQDFLTEDKIEIEYRATLDAIKKAEAWRKKYPRVRQKESLQQANDTYEVSTKGDKRFSALVATFREGTIIEGINVGGRTIEDVYQSVIKKSRKGQAPSEDSILIHDPVKRPEDAEFLNTLPKDLARSIANDFTGERKASREQLEDYSYYRGYLPLWQEWASQNPELIEELRTKSVGKTLTDQFAKTKVSQARALTDILNNSREEIKNLEENHYKNNGTEQSDNNKVLRSLSVPSDDMIEQYNQMMSIPQEVKDLTYSNELPEVGTDVISVDKDTPRAKALMAFSAPIRKDREVLLSKQFSSIIDAAYEELLETSREELNEAISNKDLDKVSELTTRIDALNDPETGRRKVVEEITVEEILNRLRAEWESYLEQTEEELDDAYGEGQGKYMINEYQKVLDHFNVLIEDAALYIEKNEGIRIMIDRHQQYSAKDSENVLGGVVTEDIQTQESRDEENNDDEDSRINNSEGWGFKVRFVDPHSTVSKVVKRVLGNIIKENNYSGEPELDDLGNMRYLEEENAHAILMEGLSGMIDADDFSTIDEAGNIVSLPALEKMTDKYPWVNQVIDAILADNDLASKFFADFRKEFISYWAQKEGKTFMLNKAIAVEDTRNEAIHNYETGSKLSEFSIYNTNRTINTENAEKGVNKVDDILETLSEYDEDEIDSIADSTLEALKMLGINTNTTVIKNTINSEDGIRHLEDVLYAAKEIFLGAEELKEDAHLIDSFEEEYNKIATVVGIVSETGGISSFRSGDKTFYSYSASNYLDGMFKSFKRDDRRESYLAEQFKKFKWFFENNEWKNDWLRQIEEDEEVRNVMSLIELNNINDTYYTEWSPTQIKSAFIKQYFAAGYNPGSKKQFGWYNFPIFSDSPVVKFIKFTRYTEDFENELLSRLSQVVKQELGRIKHVQDRRAKGVPAISNYDKRGDKFHFFPELNYLTNSSGIKYKDLMTQAKNDGNYETLEAIIEEALTNLMNNNFNKFLRNLTAIQREKITNDLITEGIITIPEELEDKLKEYFWNQTYATSQIIQITTTDLAFYKNQVDFQKRYKEVYGAGTKLNTNSKYGKKIERTIYLSDQIITSFKYQNIKDIINDADNISDIDKAFILTKFRDINVDDAQAYRSLDSFRSILDMLGKWTPEMEKTYNRIVNNEWDISDFNIVWQTIKPFVFTQISKPDGLGGEMKVPHQNKNSEFLIMAMYSMFSKEMNKSPKLRALNRFMKDNDIDVAQFESAAKVGGQGIININVSPSEWAKLSDKYDSFESYKKHMDNELNKGNITQEEYNEAFKTLEPSEEEVYQMLEEACFIEGEINPYVVHELPYSDYVVQQPTPEHLFDALGIYGSQFRNLIISDISEDAVFNINGKEYNKKELLELYQSLIIENLLDSYDGIKEAFDPNNLENLQAMLLKQVKGNPKYGRDIVEALQIVEVTNPVTGRTEKVFNIPLSNPTTTLKMQELINSVFKNRITKQHIRGGNAILVSDYGLTDKLNIQYNIEGDKASGIKGIECYLPAYSKQFYEPFMVTKIRRVNGIEVEYQELDVHKLQQADLDRLIGYRIPTESKYSMAPLIIKGFLPQQNGSAIMLPADITTIAGSDFDVKLY